MKQRPRERRVPTGTERLRSEILQIQARYDSGAMPPSVYAVLKRMRAELDRLISAFKPIRCSRAVCEHNCSLQWERCVTDCGGFARVRRLGSGREEGDY
jgi:hypothetical protein